MCGFTSWYVRDDCARTWDDFITVSGPVWYATLNARLGASFEGGQTSPAANYSSIICGNKRSRAELAAFQYPSDPSLRVDEREAGVYIFYICVKGYATRQLLINSLHLDLSLAKMERAVITFCT